MRIKLSLCLWLAAVLYLIPAAANAAVLKRTGKEQLVVLADTRQFDFADPGTGRAYRIFLYVPPLPPPPQGWPSMLLTDGNFTFPAAWAQLRTGMVGGELRPAVLIGIGYPTDDPARLASLRTRDLTPTPPADDLPLPPGAPRPDPRDYGGADSFQAFLSGPLLAEVEKQIRIDRSDLALFGHSLGGLFATRVLLTDPGAFRTYAISSPALWFNNRFVLKDLDGIVARLREQGATPRILLSVGLLEQTVPQGPYPPGFTPELVRTLNAQAAMVDNARGLARHLEPLARDGRLELDLVPFEGERHSSVIAAAISRAIAVWQRPYHSTQTSAPANDEARSRTGSPVSP